MSFPKLKYPILCRITSYVVVIGGGLLPTFIVSRLNVPATLTAIVFLGSLTGLLVFLVRNFMVLMGIDLAMAFLSCYKTARKKYALPPFSSADVILRRALRYGTHCAPGPIKPQPCALQYKFSFPMTIYSRGIERVLAIYRVGFLDKDIYQDILRSARANSSALSGKKRARFLDKAQKKESLHRVTVVLILADRLDPMLSASLYELVCSQCGDEFKNCLVPCVVDLEHRGCVFNCLRLPYVGYSYPVKNRGIRIVKRVVFGGNLNLKGSPHFLEPPRDIDREDSLWAFWKKLRGQLVGSKRANKSALKPWPSRKFWWTRTRCT